MRLRTGALSLVAVCWLLSCRVHAETPDEWITLGARIHGAFGAFIPIGIRIGLDSVQRLDAKPRELIVTYYDSDASPCACIADGIMLATTASPGQRSMIVASEKAPADLLAEVVIRNKRTGESVRYRVASRWMAEIGKWNRTLDERGRYDAVMGADGLYEVEQEK